MIFIRIKNDWGDKEIKWQNVIIALLVVVVMFLLLS